MVPVDLEGSDTEKFRFADSSPPPFFQVCSVEWSDPNKMGPVSPVTSYKWG